jgi:hypothetical protein
MVDVKALLKANIAERQAGKIVPAGKPKKKPTIKKGKKMCPFFEGWSRYVPTQFPELKGSYERFLTTHSVDISIMRELYFKGKKKSFEAISSKLVDAYTTLCEDGRIVDIAKYPKTAKIPFISWFILMGNTTYNKKQEDEILPDLKTIGVNFDKQVVKARDDPNLNGGTLGYPDGKTAGVVEEDDEDEEEDK